VKFGGAYLIAIACVGQAQTPAFDVISIKPSGGGIGEPPQLSSGRLRAHNVNVHTLLYMAYEMQNFQISGAPGWLESERYDVDAKSDVTADAAQSRLMLQALLADRFKLKIHRDTKEMTAYSLVVPTGKMHKLTPADKTGCEADPMSPTNPCEHIRTAVGFVITGEKLSMPMFCKMLSSLFHLTVVDKTGLDGVFDLKLDLGKAGFAPTPGQPASEIDGLNAVMSGLQDQLGLKLERSKSMVEILTIDHIEKPSAN